jgi:hypothetical protein
MTIKAQYTRTSIRGFIRNNFRPFWLRYIFGGIVILFGALLYIKSVPNNLIAADIEVFDSLGLSKPSQNLTFEQEISLIRQGQEKIFKLAPFGKAIPDYRPREVADLLEYGSGFCYDRSRSFDKLFSYLGFETRHVFILFKEDRSFFSALFRKKQGSHAVTEVKTSRGWMYVDSNTPWIAITGSGEVVDADDVWKRFDEFDNPPPYLNQPWWAIRGLYTRGGRKYPPYIPFPEMSWPTFFNWAIHG